MWSGRLVSAITGNYGSVSGDRSVQLSWQRWRSSCMQTEDSTSANVKEKEAVQVSVLRVRSGLACSMPETILLRIAQIFHKSADLLEIAFLLTGLYFTNSRELQELHSIILDTIDTALVRRFILTTGIRILCDALLDRISEE